MRHDGKRDKWWERSDAPVGPVAPVAVSLPAPAPAPAWWVRVLGEARALERSEREAMGRWALGIDFALPEARTTQAGWAPTLEDFEEAMGGLAVTSRTAPWAVFVTDGFAPRVPAWRPSADELLPLVLPIPLAVLFPELGVECQAGEHALTLHADMRRYPADPAPTSVGALRARWTV